MSGLYESCQVWSIIPIKRQLHVLLSKECTIVSDFIAILAANLITLWLAVRVTKRMILRWEQRAILKAMYAVNINPAKLSPAQLEAIYAIPLAFPKNEAVFNAWRSYTEHLHYLSGDGDFSVDEQKNLEQELSEETEEHYARLLSAIRAALGRSTFPPSPAGNPRKR